MILENKVALITGASRGIGREVAIEMAKAGADIVINYIGDKSLAEEVRSQVEALGRKAIILEADVSNLQAVEKMLAAAIAEFSRVDILVNNAGGGGGGLYPPQARPAADGSRKADGGF